MPGPTRTPKQFKVIAGTTRPDRDDRPGGGPQFPLLSEFPECPQHLNPDGVAMWKHLGPLLVASGVLQVADLYALEQLCYAWQLFRQKAKAGMDVTASENNALRGLFAEFGMSPAARRRVVAGITEAPPESRFAKFGKKQEPA